MRKLIQIYREGDSGGGNGGGGDAGDPTPGTEPTPTPATPVVPLDPAVLQAMIAAEASKLVQSTVQDDVAVIEGTDIVAPSNWDDMDAVDQKIYIAEKRAQAEAKKAIEDFKREINQNMAMRDSVDPNFERVSSKGGDALKPYVEQVRREMPGVFAGPLTDQNIDTILLLAEGKKARDKSASAAPIDAVALETNARDSELAELESYLPLMKGNTRVKEILSK